MPKPERDLLELLDDVGSVLQGLEDLGLQPVLIGGMALVLRGSRRVTRDYDLVIPKPKDDYKSVLNVFYDKGFELASKLDKDGDIIATLDNRNIASVRIRLDEPGSIYFLNPKTDLRIDLLFDFPMPAKDLSTSAKTIKIHKHVFRIASDQDLLRMKELAVADRKKSGDSDDIEFLKTLLKGKRP